MIITRPFNLRDKNGDTATFRDGDTPSPTLYIDFHGTDEMLLTIDNAKALRDWLNIFLKDKGVENAA